MNDKILMLILLVAGIFMLIFYGRRKHTVISVVCGMLSGGGALLLMNFFGDSLGYSPPLNLFNTALSLILGVPGAILIMAANLFL